ncbi:MAG: acyl-CoA dehydratase activase [Lachnospiraceae bacterium]
MENDKSIYTMGIDIGSTASKCIILKNGKEIAGKSLISFGAGTSGPERAGREVLKQAGITADDLSFVLATGYGRNMVDIAGAQMSELSCHARGAFELFPDVRTVIDIGGQDAKVLRIGRNGMMENFVMNDKCAAGTGRFLEVMARILEVDINDMAELSAQAKNIVDISSTCTVFAESEVISQLSKNTDKCDIIKGIHRSVSGRTGGLAKRLGVVPKVAMTGGVAKNQGVVKALAEELRVEIYTSPLAQHAGALGAALFAWQKYVS